MRLAQTVARYLLAAALIYAGIGHLTFARQTFQAQVPTWLPLDADFVVLASGAVELVLGVSLVSSSMIRPYAGLATALFFIAVFPGNVSQYLTQTDAFGLNSDAARAIRLAFQPLLVIWSLWATDAYLLLKRRTKAASDGIKHEPTRVHHRLTKRDLAWAAICLVLSIGSYELLNHVPRSTPLNLATSLDNGIPLLPVFVIPYLSFLPLVFAFVPILLRHSPELFRSYFLALVASQMVMNVFYLLVPATVPRPTLSSNDVFSVLLRDLVWQVDKPVNTFPSNHVTFSVIAILVLTRCLLDKRLRLAFQIWFGVICLSTLFVHQHVIADVVSGVLLGVGASWLSSRVWRRKTDRTRLG